MAVIPVLISASSFILALCVAVTAWVSQGKTNIKAESLADEQVKENLIRVNIKLDNLSSICNETRSDIKAMDSKLQNIDKRVTILERDQQTIWKRIDELKSNQQHLLESKGE